MEIIIRLEENAQITFNQSNLILDVKHYLPLGSYIYNESLLQAKQNLSRFDGFEYLVYIYV